MSLGFAERSKAAFAARFPEIMARLDQSLGEASATIFDGDDPVDLVVDGKRIYGGDARRFAAEQVAAYMKRPLRLFMDRPSSSGLVSPICIRLLTAITEQLTAEGVDEISRHPTDCPTFLVVFGLGLGHHLAALVEQTKARWLVVVEPLVEFVAQSFAVVDWEAILARFEGQGGGVRFVTENDPGRMVQQVTSYISSQGVSYVDGSFVFTHYPLWAFAEARKRLHEAIAFAFINRGFFEDELVMMTNAVANFSGRPFRLLEGRPRLHRPETAVVVGAGPSLDEAFEVLHRVRDRIVLFSGGTSLRPLLRNGLVPDFHCELENVPEVVSVLGEAAKFGDLSKITLIASATVDPRVPPLFGDVIYFFRDSVSSTQILGDKHWPISGAAPTCVNTALSMAAFMGFTEVVLFGTDCGVLPGGDHHARDTVYRDVGIWKEHAEKRFRYPMEVEGNFGGVAHTDWIYDSCRLMLAEVIAKRRLNVVNCSDGALVPGARPCVSEAVEIATAVVDRQAFRAALDRSTQAYAAGRLLEECDLAAVALKTDALFTDFDHLLDELAAGEGDFAEAYRRVLAFLAAAKDRYAYSESIISGTLVALPRIAMFFGFRIADTRVRRRLFDRFIAEFRLIATEMQDRTRALFSRLDVEACAPEPRGALG